MSLCDDANCKPNASFPEEKYPLHEEEGSTDSTEKVTTPSATEDEEQPEKAEEEKSEKEEKESGRLSEVSCNMSLDDEEKQEFCFTLYDFNGHGKVTKDDIASLVRSIYDALGKKSLPKSGSRTIKVCLAISPDGTCEEDKGGHTSAQPPHLASERKASSESSRYNSMTTASTVLTESATVAAKKQEAHSVPIHRKLPPQVVHSAGNGTGCKNSGGLHCSPRASRSRKSSSFQHQELMQWLKESTEKTCHIAPAVHDNRRQQQCHMKRGGHIDSSAHPQHRLPRPASPQDEPPVCPYRLLDRTHDCRVIGTSHLPSYMEGHHQRRSQSQEEDASPRHGPCRGACRGSPGSHHHYRHRERDLERQRAMRQVASWIEREHLGKGLDHGRAGRVIVERHEHHHLHEHIHHHYHHYVD